MSNRKIEVGCYYFPNYHADPRNEMIHGPNWTEWELVKHATPRFAGHHQPNIPAWGYEDESDPLVMSNKINAAVKHGIDFFIFDWYHYDDGPFLERALEQGFMKAPNVDQIKFCTMWANHPWTAIHPITRFGPKTLLYPGEVTPETFEKICDIHIRKYFSHPSYFTVDNCPYFSIYNLNFFIESFGSVDAAAKAIEKFRKNVECAGYKGLHMNCIAWQKPIIEEEENTLELPELVQKLGFDSVTSYVWVHHADMDKTPYTPYTEAMEQYLSHWDRMLEEYDIPYFPNVTMGWDSTPRTVQSEKWEPVGYPYMNLLGDNTPENFYQAMKISVERLSKLNQPGIMNINCWNEWTEGSYLEPDMVNGMKYLQAVKSAISQVKDSNMNEIPSEELCLTT